MIWVLIPISVIWVVMLKRLKHHIWTFISQEISFSALWLWIWSLDQLHRHSLGVWKKRTLRPSLDLLNHKLLFKSPRWSVYTPKGENLCFGGHWRPLPETIMSSSVFYLAPGAVPIESQVTRRAFLAFEELAFSSLVFVLSCPFTFSTPHVDIQFPTCDLALPGYT